MKTVAPSLAALALCLAATGAPAQDSRVSGAFAHPERYADLRPSCVSREADARALADELVITVTNVDMAGEIESWRGPERCELRAPAGS